jgi:hypothetical protein
MARFQDYVTDWQREKRPPHSLSYVVVLQPMSDVEVFSSKYGDAGLSQTTEVDGNPLDNHFGTLRAVTSQVQPW